LVLQIEISIPVSNAKNSFPFLYFSLEVKKNYTLHHKIYKYFILHVSVHLVWLIDSPFFKDRMTFLFKFLRELPVKNLGKGLPRGIAAKSGQLVEEAEALAATRAMKNLNVVLSQGFLLACTQIHRFNVFCLRIKIMLPFS
jgi:hypothetical protein